jgi:DNA replication and repair protein RecF
MHFQGLSLQHFRLYTQQTFLFPQPTTVIVAKNASGKTSIIEAINLLTTGESFRAEHIQEMIQFGAELGRVKGKIENGEAIELEVILTHGQLQGKRVQSRLYSVNNVRRRKKDFAHKFFTVVFRPEDMRLIEGSPGRRRQFVDTVLSQADPHYAVALKTYEDGLKRRNRLLDQVREGSAPRSVLKYWTDLILKHGQMLQEKRRDFFGFFHTVDFPMSFSVEYQPSLLTETRLAEYSEKEVAAGHTLIGPHKDDFSVSLVMQDGQLHNVATFGSRGQQRMGVLWLKTGELRFLEEAMQMKPLLLLDDILSELDEDHRGYVLSLLSEMQSIITTTEDRMVEEVKTVASKVDIIHL